MNNARLVSKFHDAAHSRTQLTIGEIAMKNNNKSKELISDLATRIHYILNSHRIPMDLCMRNIIQSCLDFSRPQTMAERANSLLDYIYLHDFSIYQMHMLLGMFEQIVNMEAPLKKYGKFFSSNTFNEKDTTVFS